MTTATAGPEAAVEYRWHMLLEEIEELSTRLSKATGSALRASSARLESLAAATEARLSATEAARQPGSDAHKGHDSSGPRRGLRNGGVGWAFKLPSPARRTTTGPVETQEDFEPEKAFLPLHEDYVQRCLVRAQRSSELVPSSKLLLDTIVVLQTTLHKSEIIEGYCDHLACRRLRVELASILEALADGCFELCLTIVSFKCASRH